jgi:MFS family permease
MIAVCAFAAVIGGVLALLGEARQSGRLFGIDVGFAALSPWVLIAAATLFGSAIYSQYSLCVAHTNDFVSREEFVEASSGLLLTWGIGASIGPLIAALAMQRGGLGGLFVYTALVHSGFALLTLHRITQRMALPPAQRPDFVQQSTTVRTTPVSAALDPRAPDEPAPQVSSEASSAPREAMK